ncbi:MAG: response regulator [Verrucomicrobia bacterium]|nr:response regulator [Verrucomicrobiota bacterium]
MDAPQEVARPAEAQATARILVVDDDTCIFDIFGEICPSPLFFLTVASHGRLAVQLAGSQHFDLAFVDYFLGQEIGTEVAQQMRKVQPGMKVVLMSGFLVEDRAAAMEKAGAGAFLIKPFSIENAQSVIKRLLGARGSERLS